MSFHWNLSSDEEDEGLEELWAKAAKDQDNQEDDDDDDDDSHSNNNGGLFAFDMAMASVTAPKPPPVATLPAGFGGDDSDGDSDSIDWEDADNNNNNSVDDGHGGDQKLAAKPTGGVRQMQPVTINIGATKRPATKKEESKKDEKKPNKTRRRYRFQSLPNNVQFVLENLHQTHWLALTSHVLFNSSQCSDELILPLAYSLIPPCWSNEGTTANDKDDGNLGTPTLEELRNFGQWYFEFIHTAEQRRRHTLEANVAAGAPRLAGATLASSSRRGSRQKRKSLSDNSSAMDDTAISASNHPVSSTARLVNYCLYLAASQSEDPQLWQQQQEEATTTIHWSRSDQVNLFIAMTRYVFCLVARRYSLQQCLTPIMLLIIF